MDEVTRINLNLTDTNASYLNEISVRNKTYIEANMGTTDTDSDRSNDIMLNQTVQNDAEAPYIQEPELNCIMDFNLLDAIKEYDNANVMSLLDKGADPNVTCYKCEFSACYLAIQCDNHKALELLLQHGAERHWSGNLKTTPLHLAAWKGNVLQIAMLLNLPKDIQDKIAADVSVDILKDVQRLTWRKPAWGADDRKTLKTNIKDTISKWHCWKNRKMHNCQSNQKNGSEMSAHWSALHIASSRALPSCVRLLLAASAGTGVDASTKDCLGRTPLDVVGSAYYMGEEIDMKHFREVFNVFLDAGVRPSFCLPLHTAVDLQDQETIELMMKLLQSDAYTSTSSHQQHTANHSCVIPSLKDHLQIYFVEFPLHLAVEIGHVDMLTDMLFQIKHTDAINCPNNIYEMALYIAINNNNVDCVKVLLNYGAWNKYPEFDHHIINYAHFSFSTLLCYIYSILLDKRNDNEDYNMKSLLCLAIKRNYVECVKVLFSFNKKHNSSPNVKIDLTELTECLHLAANKNFAEIAQLIIDYDNEVIDQIDTKGYTALQRAAINGNRDIALLLLRNRADLAKPIEINDITVTALDLIMERIMKPTQFLEKIFDECITSDDEFCQKVKVQYAILLPKGDNIEDTGMIKALLNTGNRHGQRTLLGHPLVESFIYLKWQPLLPFFYITLAMYGFFMVSLNAYIICMFLYIDTYRDQKKELSAIASPVVWKYLVIISVIIAAFEELLQMKINYYSKAYFRSIEIWINLGLIVLSTFLPFVVTYDSTTIPEWVRLMSAVAILMSCIKMTFLLSRLPNWGLYLLIFEKVAIKVVKIILTFAFLIFGFSMCFMIITRAKGPFGNPMAALVKTMVMLTGEFDYENTIDEETAKQIGSSITILRTMFIAFLVLGSIVLINLTVGVAVNNVNHLQQIGHIRRLVKQAELLISLQKKASVFNKIIYRNFLDDTVYLEQDNNNDKFSLPRRIKHGIFEIAHSKKHEIINKNHNEMLFKKIDKLHEAVTRVSEQIEIITSEKTLKKNKK